MALGAEGDAHAELPGALSDASRDHSVESNGGQQDACRAEDAGKHRAELECEEPATLPNEMLAHRSDIEDANRRVHVSKHLLNLRHEA